MLQAPRRDALLHREVPVRPSAMESGLPSSPGEFTMVVQHLMVVHSGILCWLLVNTGGI